MTSWLFDWASAWTRTGDVASIRSLPHMGQAAAEYALRVRTPDGKQATVAPSPAAFKLPAPKLDNAVEVAKLIALLAEGGAQ
jgi:hypothetical protein